MLVTRRQLLLGLLPLPIIPNGDVAGGDELVLNNGGIRGIRNIQGGTPNDPNLDIAAGDKWHRGRTKVNWDLGKSFDIFDGHENLLARFDHHGITFYKKPHISK